LKNISNELPMGFGIALYQNERALSAFSALSDAEKKRVIEGTHQVESETDMKRYVDKIGR
jgi:hypothetical protein